MTQQSRQQFRSACGLDVDEFYAYVHMCVCACVHVCACVIEGGNAEWETGGL